MKIVERVRMGSRGAGSLFKQAGSLNWFSSFSRHGVEHVESCGTADLKAAKKIHKGRLDKLASERHGHEVFLDTYIQKRVDGGTPPRHDQSRDAAARPSLHAGDEKQAAPRDHQTEHPASE